ncbi:MAG: cyclic nucleotide-binding domain-containing protein [Thermodesulfobacteriota bacterium]
MFLSLFRNYVDAAFLKRYGVDQLPLMLAINAALTFAAFWLFNRLCARWDDARLLAGVFVANGALAGLLFWGVGEGVELCYPLLFQLLYLQDSILLVYLWNIACDRFDSRQGKRLFPLVTAAQVLGVVAGNFASDGLARLLGHDQILLVYGGGCLALAAALRRVNVVVPARPGSGHPAESVHRPGLAEIPGLLRRYPIVRYLAVAGLLPNVLLPIFLYQFSVIVNQGFASEQDLLSFLSLFRGFMTLAVFLLLLAMGRLYARIGVVNASLALPVNFVLIFAALTASFGLQVALAGQFLTRLAQQAVAGPVNKVLFNLVPREVAGWTRVFVRGAVVKTGMLTGALLMVVLTPVLDPRGLAPLAAVIALYWIVETLAFRRHFQRALKQIIASDAVDFERIDALRLRGQGGLDASLTLDGAAEAGPAETGQPAEAPLAVEDALAMLADPDPLLRAQAAAFFGRRPDMRAARRLVELLDDQDTARKLAVDSLLRYGPDLRPFLEASLADPRPRLRHGVLEVVRLAGGMDFDVTPLVMEELGRVYNRLADLQALAAWGQSPGLAALRAHLAQANQEGLGLVFHALWVRHKDMRLMYAALTSLGAPAAMELMEVSLERGLVQLLMPLVEKAPAREALARARGALVLRAPGGPEAALMGLARSRDRVTRLLAVFVMGEARPGPVFLPAAEMLLEDEHPQVREAAAYAYARGQGLEARMPAGMERMEQLRGFALFRGLGLRECEALSAIARPANYRPGEPVVTAGQEQAGLVLVLAGVLGRDSGLGSGEDSGQPGRIGPGGWLGELELFTQAEAAHGWTALEAVEALVLPYGQLSEIMSIYTGVGLTFCRHFAARLQGREATVPVFDPPEPGGLA